MGQDLRETREGSTGKIHGGKRRLEIETMRISDEVRKGG